MFRNSLSIELVEPVVHLRGHPKDKHTTNLLRGMIRICLAHPVHIRSVTIQFVGTAKTLWPEVSHHWDKQVLVDSVIPICRLPMYLKKGTHSVPFEVLLSNALSESIECGLGRVRYKLLCRVNVKPWSTLFGSYLKAYCPVVLVRLPPTDTPRCITQTHVLADDQLNIVIDSAHITPGSNLSLSVLFSKPGFSIDQLVVKLIERQKFRAPSKHTTRILHHEITLTSSDPHIVDRDEIRAVYVIPDKQTLQIHPSTANRNIRVRHWIQVSLRLLLPGQTSTPKEILMDAPITVLESPIDDYITLPVYEQTEQTDTTYYTPEIEFSVVAPASCSSSSWLKRIQKRYLSKEDAAPPKYSAISDSFV